MDIYKRAKKSINNTYKKHKSLENSICMYCGWDGFTQEHVPGLTSAYIYKLEKYPKIIIRACRECNSTLNFVELHSIESRAGYLVERYEQKYKSLLLMPHWDEEDLDELTGKFRTWIESQAAQRLVII